MSIKYMFISAKSKITLKSVMLFSIFILLTISISNNLMEIYTSSSSQQSVYVPIIMYHQVKNSGFGKDVISPYEFENDLKYLADNEYTTVTIDDLIDYVYEGKDLPEKPIILSFDDGYLSTYQYVFPLLKEYNMKIVLSVIGKCTDDFSNVVDININYSHMTWEQINEVDDSGLVEIQNHSYNLHRVCNGRYGCSQMTNEAFSVYEEVMKEDILTLQQKIASKIDKTPSTFTYPYGKYNSNTEAILKNLGFKATLTVKYGVNLVNRDDPETLFNLKRICRSHNQGIKKLLNEVMDLID
jgi:peptidoglycan/xylan/chitin deacetylase (PgdA/CDA1 family)